MIKEFFINLGLKEKMKKTGPDYLEMAFFGVAWLEVRWNLRGDTPLALTEGK